jgi:hypothetical protein
VFFFVEFNVEVHVNLLFVVAHAGESNVLSVFNKVGK